MIYIMTHKKFNDPKLDGYVPLQVGAEGKDEFGYLKDNTGDNISNRNANYCELTGLYWMWKNCKDEYIGLVHYRRYFGKCELCSSYRFIYSYQEMVNLLNGCDVILPKKEIYKCSAHAELVRRSTTEAVYGKLRTVIERMYPEYVLDYDNFFGGNKAFQYNIMFCRREVFCSYCQWLFDILFELEKCVDLSELDEYQKRIYGFLSERLLNIWIIHNLLNVNYLPIIQTEIQMEEKLRMIRRRCTNRIRFMINQH